MDRAANHAPVHAVCDPQFRLQASVFLLLTPLCERALGEGQIVITQRVGHLSTQPRWPWVALIGVVQFQLGHGQAGVVAEELVDRSEERRVGKECVSTGKSGGSR